MDENRMIRRFKRMAAESDSHIEERAVLNDVHRTYTENGYNLTTIRMDNERVELLGQLRELGKQRKTALARLQKFEWRSELGDLNLDDILYGGFEFEEDLKRIDQRIIEVSQRLGDIDKGLNQRFDESEDDGAGDNVWCLTCQFLTPDQYKACQKAKEKAKNYEGKAFHYAIAHNVARTKERKLRTWLKRSSEEQDKVVLLRIDRMKKRMEITGPWYYLLSMLVVRKHANTSDVANFSNLSKEDKRKARRDKAQFWAAACDRLVNFRKTNEERAKANGREWALPHDKVTLEVKEVSYNDELRTESLWTSHDLRLNPYSMSEDALIALIDRRNGDDD
jgi:hypothetical protein